MDKKLSPPIIDSLGEEALLNLGLSQRNINEFRWKGVFPAMWYKEIRALCFEAGIPCPLAAFSFKQPKQLVRATSAKAAK